MDNEIQNFDLIEEQKTDGMAESKPASKSSTKGFLMDALETVAIALIIFFVIYTFIAQPHLVRGESMLPNYHDGEYILTSKLYHWVGTPERGDVIVLKSPEDSNVQFIKRIIGLPGEKIKISNNQVIITNKEHPEGFALNEEYLGSATNTNGGNFLHDGEEITIPDDKYVVMGDNRNFSYDSRSWGLLDKNKIIGKAFFVYWPLPQFGFVAHAEYDN